MAILLIVPWSQYAMDRPSGEKTGLLTPFDGRQGLSLPWMGLASSSDNDRRNSR